MTGIQQRTANLGEADSAANLTVDAEPAGTSAAVLTLRGCLDIYTAEILLKRVKEQSERGARHLILDMSEVFIDSAGLGALIAARRATAERGAALALASIPEMTLRVLRITGLTALMDIYPEPDDAIAATQATTPKAG